MLFHNVLELGLSP